MRFSFVNIRDFFLGAGIAAALVVAFFFFMQKPRQSLESNNTILPAQSEQTQKSPTATATPIPSLPASYIIPQQAHMFQSFNNCGPASLSMLLSYHGINVSQAELGQALRPWQNPEGVNDDKSVTLEELAKKGSTYDLVAYHRPNGNIEILKQFVSQDVPVVVRTWLEADSDIGHYRVVRGFDDTTQELIQDDSLQGKNLRYSYNAFQELWKPFNFEYLVLVQKDKQEIAESILGDEIDAKVAWQNARSRILEELKTNPDDMHSLFNMSIASYHVSEYDDAISYFEQVESRLPFRTLWYQIEPIQAYAAVKNYDRVFSITNQILNNHNRAFSELYIIRGKIHQEQGNLEAARQEFQNAVYYNQNLKEAQDLLTSL